MTKKEYIGTLEIRGHKVNIGLDDYGQQYFFEFLNNKNQLTTIGCGAYENDFIEYICYYFDEKGYYISSYGLEAWQEKIAYIEEVFHSRMEKYPDDVEMKKHYESMIYHMKYDDYDLYDFDALYKQLNLLR